MLQFTICMQKPWLTVSRVAEAWRSGRKPTSNMWSRKAWSSMPYTRSRKSTIEVLWSGQKQAAMSGSVTVPSEIERIEGVKSWRLMSRFYRSIPSLTSYLSLYLIWYKHELIFKCSLKFYIIYNQNNKKNIFTADIMSAEVTFKVKVIQGMKIGGFETCYKWVQPFKTQLALIR